MKRTVTQSELRAAHRQLVRDIEWVRAHDGDLRDLHKLLLDRKAPKYKRPMTRAQAHRVHRYWREQETLARRGRTLSGWQRVDIAQELVTRLRNWDTARVREVPGRKPYSKHYLACRVAAQMRRFAERSKDPSFHVHFDWVKRNTVDPGPRREIPDYPMPF